MINLVYGLGVMAICLFLQALLLVLVIHHYARRQSSISANNFFANMMLVSSVMTMLVIGNLIQLSIWGVLFYYLEEFDEMSTAIYHSAVNFATLGYGDLVMSERHRLLGPLEAINGVLMIGVSTAALMAVFQDLIKKKIGP